MHVWYGNRQLLMVSITAKYMFTFRLVHTYFHFTTVVLHISMNLAVKLNLAVKIKCVAVVLFPARCCLTLCYPPQSNKDVVVLVRCSQQLIREEVRLERTSTIAIGSYWKEILCLPSVDMNTACTSKNFDKCYPHKLMYVSEFMWQNSDESKLIRNLEFWMWC